MKRLSVNNVDSDYSRQSAGRAGTLGDKKNRKQYNGREIQKVLGIDNEPFQSTKNASSLSMMDIVLKNWDIDNLNTQADEEEKDDNEDDYDNEEEKE